ncbi:hypothetical protein JRQ81_013787 [Phrynocephalus forsythii]|uniref:Testis-expressed sequence 15 protein n=1 Tax=Phrynocephalus forsythii TaxID=171643 RepID=A0A9Q0Y1T8_9SAUR|nr:hypothetical protein JRQ81_013787 [Phrynocephalus forsythii]
MEATRKNIASNTKTLFFPEKNLLKNFTIPKRIPDKDVLKECSTQQRDYSEIKQLLSQCCLDMECNFENFWRIDKVEVVQNKHLEEDFIAKRAMLREEGRQNKETSCFLAVSKEEVSKICQGGLHVGHSKKELNIMQQLGNPQLGVYLFRYVDIALRYASQHFFPVENIIIFRVLLGKVKKVQPPKGKKKVVLDPTPNFDCHISRINPSVKDSLQEQTIGSLVYFYEYNELSKPVKKPRQCLPYAVIKIKSVNQKMGTGCVVKSLKRTPKMLPKNVGGSIPLENCTRVTRIGKSQLIYEHFRKPVESYAEKSENNATAEVSPFSRDIHNWSGSVAETQGTRLKCNSTRKWDVTYVDTDEPALQYTSNDVCSNVTSNNMGIAPTYDSAVSTVITSKVIKDPRLSKREQNPGKQNGETDFSTSSQHENEMQYNLEMTLSATLGIPYTVPDDSFLFESNNAFSQRCCTEKTWKENIAEASVSPFLLSGVQGLGIKNKEIISSQITPTDALETYLALQLLKSEEYRNKPHGVIVENLKGEKGMTHIELPSSQWNTSERMDDMWTFQDSRLINKKHIIKPLSFEVTDICVSEQNPENETSGIDEIPGRKEMVSLLEDVDSYTSEVHCTAETSKKWVIDKCSSSEECLGKICPLQNRMLHSAICENIVSENVVSEDWNKNNCICRWPSDEMDAEQFEQNKLQTIAKSENSNIIETHKNITFEKAEEPIAIREVDIINDTKEISTEEKTSSMFYATSSDTYSVLLNLYHEGSVPEMFEKDTEMKCGNINTQDLKLTNEAEKTLGERTKCLTVPLKPCNYGNMTNENNAYHYLLEQMDWDTLFRKASLNTEISGNASINENKNNYLYSRHSSGAGRKSELMFPDLQVTITNSSQSELETDIGKHPTKDPGQRSGMKCLRKKMVKKYTQSRNKCKLYGKKKELKCYPAEIFSLLSKGWLTKIAQSEKHIKNILNALNMEALLCKNKLLSQKLDGVVFHLRKAQRRVQSLKNVIKARRRNGDNSSKTCEVLHVTTTIGDTKENFNSEASSCASKNIANCLISATKQKELVVYQGDEIEDEGTCKSDEKISTVTLVTSLQSTGDSLVVANALQPDDVSMILENDFSKEEFLEVSPAQKNSVRVSSGGFTVPPMSGTRTNQKPLLNEYSNNYIDCSSDMKCTQLGVEWKCSDFKIKMSEVLQKADETSSLNFLHDQIIFCKSFLPLFIKAFEKKQGCFFECVLVSRAILEDAGENIPLNCKLKPSAIESLVELQIIMETIEFIENKIRLIEGEPTFRSLLWYDDSLCNELFGDQSGYQQQSNLYPAFQRRLKYSALSELQSYHKQLVDIFENTRWENSSYYTFLKARRELKECEAALKSDFSLSNFFLSVPYVCGANYGDTLEDLEDIRTNTVNLINLCKSVPPQNLNAEKEYHFWVIVEIVATKVEFIKTCEEVNIKTSLFGIENIFFDAAKSLVWQERTKSINENFKGGEMSCEAILSKFFEICEHVIELISKRSAEECYISKNENVQQKVSTCIRDSLIQPQDICCIGEILHEAQYANTERLQQLMFRCTEHLEILKTYFQILQEEDASVFITKENVLGFMKSGGINPVILKPEAVEVYTEMAMTYETVFFLKNSIARKVDEPTFRSLLWFDLSLLPEFIRSQEKMASFSYRKDSLSNIIESTISELQDELNVIYEYPENVNFPYALHLLTRELAELSEIRNLLKTSQTPISMCVDLVPYTICLNYGNTVAELDCNYKQFSTLLEKLMLAERKDIGKMAHIMKIMKTIEHMKFICSEQDKSPLPLVIYQMLKNWRKACQLKRQNVKTNLDVDEEYGNKDSPWSSHALYKRLADVTSDDAEERERSQSKKKKKEWDI